MAKRINTTSYNFQQPDITYDKFQAKLTAFLLKEDNTRFTLTAEEKTKLTNANNEWTLQYGLSADKSTRTPVVVLAKNKARKALSDILRLLVRKHIGNNDTIDSATRESLGLTVKDVVPSEKHIPNFKIVLVAESQAGGTIILRMKYSENGSRREIPKGADGFEIYQLMDEISTDNKDYRFVAIASKNPYKIYFTDTIFIGRKVSFVVRFYNTKGETGTWSNFVTAVII
ncbi:MAG: hypothetical protein LBL13_03920 [Bacteroidales bacterium]|jgi:hypothetical protein|nr:hypothetical protein [Bacteroidales bacterium]